MKFRLCEVPMVFGLVPSSARSRSRRAAPALVAVATVAAALLAPSSASAVTALPVSADVHRYDVSEDGVAMVGEDLGFLVRVVNAGTETLSDVRVDATVLSAGDTPLSCTIGTMAPGSQGACAIRYAATATDAAAGAVRLRLVPTAYRSTGEAVAVGPMDASTPMAVTTLSTRLTVREQRPDGVAEEGEALVVEAATSNDGNVWLDAVATAIPALRGTADDHPCSTGSLAPWAGRLTCESWRHVVTAADVAAGSISFAATSSARTQGWTNLDGTTVPGQAVTATSETVVLPTRRQRPRWSRGVPRPVPPVWRTWRPRVPTP